MGRPRSDSRLRVRRARRLAWVSVLGVATAAGFACRREGGAAAAPGPTDEGTTHGGGTGTDTNTGTDAAPEPVAASCFEAAVVGLGRFEGVLPWHDHPVAWACAPSVVGGYLLVHVAERSDLWVSAVGRGFSPRVAVWGGACSEPEGAALACTRGAGAWVLDVPARATLLLAVSADEDDPGVGVPRNASGEDGVFTIDLFTRPILEEGHRCRTDALSGRCALGTACEGGTATDVETATGGESTTDGETSIEAGSDTEEGVGRCRVVPGTTCANAPSVEVGPAGVELVVPNASEWPDGYLHSCTERGRPERVYRLEPARGFDPAATLVVEAESPEVGLAIRRHPCRREDEIACAGPGPSGAEARAPTWGQRAALGEPLFLFVELPSAAPDAMKGEPQGPYTVRLRSE